MNTLSTPRALVAFQVFALLIVLVSIAQLTGLSSCQACKGPGAPQLWLLATAVYVSLLLASMLGAPMKCISLATAILAGSHAGFLIHLALLRKLCYPCLIVNSLGLLLLLLTLRSRSLGRSTLALAGAATLIVTIAAAPLIVG